MKQYIEYDECPVLCKINRKKEPLITRVPIDEFTNMVQNNFDYTFTGESKIYPYELPKEIQDIDFGILAIVGASGSGKSTLLKEFGSEYNFNEKNMIVLRQSYLTLILRKMQVIN